MKYFLKIFIVAAFSFFGMTDAFSQSTITVTDCNLNGWLKQPVGNSSLGFVNGPSTTPLGTGSMKFNVPAGGIFWPGDFVRFRNGQYSGTRLSTLTELSFSTFVEARDTIADIHFMVVLVDINGDGTAEHNLVFDPRYQNPGFIRGTMIDQGITSEHVWQDWDALHGGWFYGGVPETDPDHNGPFFTLPEYLALYPNAAIRNDAAKGGPAIRLSAGGVVFKPNFFGSMDNFKIGVNGVTTTYDFEFSTANAGVDKHVVYGYGSNCTTLTGSAAGGVGPYSYLWSPGGSTPANTSTVVCPTTTTTYTLTVTDHNGCSRQDAVTVFVNDVRCGSKLEKVKLCHNGVEICVAAGAVQAHLDHGDQLGTCETEAITNSAPQLKTGNRGRMELSNYPNPFQGTTKITYELPFKGRSTIKIYNSNGIKVATIQNSERAQGRYSVDFNSPGLNAGIYYYQLTVYSQGMTESAAGKMIITGK